MKHDSWPSIRSLNHLRGYWFAVGAQEGSLSGNLLLLNRSQRESHALMLPLSPKLFPKRKTLCRACRADQNEEPQMEK